MNKTAWSALLVVYAIGCDPKPNQSTSELAKPTGEAGTGPRRTDPATLVPGAPREAGATKEPERPVSKKRYVVAALGDSITDDKGGGGGYLRVAQRLCPQSVFYNFGRGGDMTNQMLRRLKSDILPVVDARDIDTIIVYGGVNDLYSDLTAGRKNDVIERDLKLIYTLSKEAGLRVVPITVSPWGGFSKYWNPRRGENTQLLNSWILGSSEQGLSDAVVDSYPLLSCGDPTKLCPEYERRVPDGLHPGAAGHEKLGEKLFEVAFPNCR